MLTLAFGQLLFVISYYWVSMTGGDDGLVGIPTGRFATPGLASLELRDPSTYYLVVLACAAVGLAVYRILVDSSFGIALRAIRENRLRVTFIGGDVPRIRRRVFVLAGAGAGLAGALYAPFQGFISPEILYWTKSGEILLATVLGGMFSFWGPAVGASLMLWLKDLLLTYMEHWKIVLGTALLVIVLFMPGGLVGFLEARLADLHRHGRRAAD
jgi:branched-chain amino acid transport system permease protein